MSKHLLAVDDLSKEEILAVLDSAEDLSRGTKPKQFPGTVLGLLFFQTSTRTRFGFQAAIARLGGLAVLLDATKYEPRMSAPESVEDTVRSLSSYCDLFVVRHWDATQINRAAAYLKVPLISGGSGNSHHPTQALIDLFAIRRWHGRLAGLRIGIVGDLPNSRAAKSLLLALSRFPPAELRIMCPDRSGTVDHIPRLSPHQNVSIHRQLSLDNLDVLYLAGLPPGRASLDFPDEVRASFSLTSKRVQELPPSCVILNPLPRIDEVLPEVDALPNAFYFQQSRDGIFVRIALLESLLSNHTQSP